MSNTGRRTRLDAKAHAAIVLALKDGHYMAHAASAAGVSLSAIQSWLADARAIRDGNQRPSGQQRSPTRAALLDLLDGVDRANHAAAELGLSAVRSAAAAGDWRASAWFLEHRFPDTWGRMERAADTTEGMDNPLHQDTDEMDDLFVRHTYLSAVIGMVVQASFGIDIRRLAETDPADLLQGRELYRATGLQGVLESDFFAWPNEVGGEALLQTLARRVARFDWAEAPPETAATLYESVIPPEERWQLGEYYTPSWLAQAMIRELVGDPLNQRVLDPACGSGTFVSEAVSHFLTAARAAKWEPGQVLERLREAVTGIDVHPVAVHLAGAAWTLAARPAIAAASAAGHDASLSIPVYLGDALQLRFRTGDMFAEHNITVQVEDEENTELVFPVSLVERAETFDALMGDVSASIERGDDPFLALDDNHVDDSAERQVMGNTIATMQRLHDKGRNHIWAYYARNMVRPVVLSRSKVDVVIGNPPWINYNQTADILRDELLNLSRNTYGIWTGGRYATHQDVAGLFFARSVDLYLTDGGVTGFVAAPQRTSGRAIFEVAQRSVAGAQVRAERFGGLHLQTGLGPGTVEAQQLLPNPRLSRLCPQAPPGRLRQAIGR